MTRMTAAPEPRAVTTFITDVSQSVRMSAMKSDIVRSPAVGPGLSPRTIA